MFTISFFQANSRKANSRKADGENICETGFLLSPWTALHASEWNLYVAPFFFMQACSHLKLVNKFCGDWILLRGAPLDIQGDELNKHLTHPT